MRHHGQARLGFFPLPIAEAKRIRNGLIFPGRFSALDPCVGDGVAFRTLLRDADARCYGIEIDSNRSEQARELEIETIHGNNMDVGGQAESLSLLDLIPPYGWEWGARQHHGFV